MRTIGVLFVLLFSFAPLSAAHLVGGEISYRCVGSNTNGNVYEIKLTVYRDCNSSGAPFDNFAPITIYGGAAQNVAVQNLSVARGQITSIPGCSCQPLPSDATQCMYRKGNLSGNCNSSTKHPWIYHSVSTML